MFFWRHHALPEKQWKMRGWKWEKGNKSTEGFALKHLDKRLIQKDHIERLEAWTGKTKGNLLCHLCYKELLLRQREETKGVSDPTVGEIALMVWCTLSSLSRTLIGHFLWLDNYSSLAAIRCCLSTWKECVMFWYRGSFNSLYPSYFYL